MKLSETQLDRASHQKIRPGQCYDSKGRGFLLNTFVIGEPPKLVLPQSAIDCLHMKDFERFIQTYGTHVVEEVKQEKGENDPLPRLSEVNLIPIQDLCPSEVVSDLSVAIEQHLNESEPIFILARQKSFKFFQWAIQMKKDTSEVTLVNQIEPDLIKSLVETHLLPPKSEETQESEKKKRKVIDSTQYEPSLFHYYNLPEKTGKLPTCFSLDYDGSTISGERRLELTSENSEDAAFCREEKAQFHSEYRVQQHRSNMFWSIERNRHKDVRTLRLTRNHFKASEFKFFSQRGVMVPQSLVNSKNEVKQTNEEITKPEQDDSYNSSDDEQPDDIPLDIDEGIGQAYMKVIEDSLHHFLSDRSGYYFDAAAIVSEIREFSDFPVAILDYCLEKLSTKSSLVKESHEGMTLYGVSHDEEFDTNASPAPSDYGNNKFRLFVRPIAKDLDKTTLTSELKSKLDGVTNVILHQDPLNMNRNRGFAFVDFETKELAQIAHTKIANSGIVIKEVIASCDWATPLNDPSDELMSKVKVIFIRYLPLDLSEASIISMFSRFGNIEKIKRSRDFCFVHFTEKNSAHEAIKVMNGIRIQNNLIEVTLAKPLDPVIRQQQLAHKRRVYGFEPYYPTTLTFPTYNDKGEVVGYGPPQPRMKLELCEFFMRGACSRGDGCRFAHGEHEIGTPVPAQLVPPPPPSRPPSATRGGISSYRGRGRGSYPPRGGYSERGGRGGNYSLRPSQLKRGYEEAGSERDGRYGGYGYESYGSYAQYPESQYPYQSYDAQTYASTTPTTAPPTAPPSQPYYQYPQMYQQYGGAAAAAAGYQQAAYYQGAQQYYQMDPNSRPPSGQHYPGF